MKKFCCVLLALLPLTAFAYPIDVQKDLNDMKIDYETFDTDNDIGSIRVANYGDVDATCKAVFNNGPEAPRTRTIDVPAGSYYVPLNQPLANLAVAALEPDTQSSYFANRLIHQLGDTARVMASPSLVFEEQD